MQEEILSLYQEILSVVNKKDDSISLPEKSFFLARDNVLVVPNEHGDARYPYAIDGQTLWAYSSGNIVLNQSNFFIFPPTLEGKEPYISFFGGIKEGDKYKVISLSGSADSEYGREFEKYVIYNPRYFIYLRKVEDILFALKGTIDSSKRVIFQSTAINLSNDNKEIFISAYLNPLLTHSPFENEETKWFRTTHLYKDYSYIESVEDISRDIHLYSYLLLKHHSNSDVHYQTSSRQDYVGNKNYSISQSMMLKKGFFDLSKPVSTFIDMAIYGDINKKTIKPKESLNVDHVLSIFYKEDLLEIEINKPLEIDQGDSSAPNNRNISIQFDKFNNSSLNNELFNRFIKSVINQVDYCSKTKNSSLSMLGIRDLYQMIEVSLLWDKETARKKILESLSFIDISGRSPRQYAQSENGNALFDNRAFIDQGQWIISTIYTYLAFTGDLSLLDEKCGYYELKGRKEGVKLDIVNSVYDHLQRIIKYLISHIDKETHMLHILYGDWNDAVDGLGATTIAGQEFGNGVSVMASEHLYKNLFEMHEINKLKHISDNYLSIANELLEGFKTHAVINKGTERKIVHGWGENKSFYVGSFKDVDDEDRYSLTSYAFYVISGMYEKDRSLKQDVLKAYESLDSKYGYKTFDKYFSKEKASRVGRIVNLPKGTAENSATYIHASMFAVRSLFQMDEGKKAFDQLYKLIPITHQKITTSPFVMPNSYGYNPDLGIDGESMNDWYTGSSNTLLKALFFDVFGLKANLDSTIIVKPISYMPSDRISFNLLIKGRKCSFIYQNLHKKERHIYVNKIETETGVIDLKDNKEYIVEIID